MSEQDALSTFDFSKVVKQGLYLKWEAGRPLTLRVLTVDPYVYNSSFEDKETGEPVITTRFAWIVYNFTDEKAQILQTTPSMAKKFGELHVDPDFGANIRNVDIKITPTGEKLQRKYDIQVLPKARELTHAMVEEAKAINLDEVMAKESGGRMSLYDPAKFQPGEGVDTPAPDDVAEVTDADLEEPIDLSSILF